MKHLFLVTVLCCLTSCTPLDADFEMAQQLFEKFDTLISPQEYAKTYSYYRSANDLWMDTNNQPVTMDIPYRDHFLILGEQFSKTQSSGTGLMTRFISRFEKGRNTQWLFHLPKLQFEGKLYKDLVYIVTIDTSKTVTQAKLFTAKGELLKQAPSNFIDE